MQHRVALVHAGRCETVIEPAPVEALDVNRCEFRELDPSESRYDVLPPADNLVAIESALSHGAAHGVVKPPLKVLAHGLILGVEDEPTIPVGHRLGELFRRPLSAQSSVAELLLAESFFFG